MALLRRIVVLIIWKYYTRNRFIIFVHLRNFPHTRWSFPFSRRVYRMFPLDICCRNLMWKCRRLNRDGGSNSKIIWDKIWFPRILEMSLCQLNELVVILICLFCNAVSRNMQWGYCPQCWNKTRRHDDDSISFPCLQAVNTY